MFLLLLVLLVLSTDAASPPPDSFVVEVHDRSFRLHSYHVKAHETIFFRFHAAGRVLGASFDSGPRGSGDVVPWTIGEAEGALEFQLAGQEGSRVRLVVEQMSARRLRQQQQQANVYEVRVGAPDGTAARFAPSVLMVPVGSTVRFLFETFGHTVTSSPNVSAANACERETGGFDSGFLQQGEVFERVFDREGTYYYHCRAHCAVGMRGAVVVQPEPDYIVEHLNASFSPQVLTIQPGDEVCFDFVAPGDVVQGSYWSSCTAAAGGFRGTSRFCRVFNAPSGSFFPFFDSAQCFYGIIIVADIASVVAQDRHFEPRFIHVAVNTQVNWTITEPGHSVSEALSEVQLSDADHTIRCALKSGGFDSGVALAAGVRFQHVFNQTGSFPYLCRSHCPLYVQSPLFWGRVTVFDPYAIPAAPTAPAAPTSAPADPCRCVRPEGMALNFYFDGILGEREPKKFCGSVVFGRVFDDRDGDGLQNAVEPGLVNVTVQLVDATGAVLNATTDALGDWLLADVAPGVTRVAVLRATLPNPAANHTGLSEDPRLINVPAGVRVDEGSDGFSAL